VRVTLSVGFRSIFLMFGSVKLERINETQQKPAMIIALPNLLILGGSPINFFNTTKKQTLVSFVYFVVINSLGDIYATT
jgi:hypothetical protein